MAFPSESLSYIGPAAAPTAGWGRYIVLVAGASALDPGRAALATDGMDNNENGLVDEANEKYPEVLTKQTINASALRYPYVRVEYKTQGGQLVRFGDADNNPATPPVENFTVGAPELRITARGRTGSADKTLEAEAVRFPLVQVESAIWAGGPLNINGNGFYIDGHDHAATAPYDTLTGASPTPGILTLNAATDVPLTSSQLDNVSGTGGDASVQQSAFTYNFNGLWNQLVPMADYSFNGAQSFTNSSPSYGSYTDPKVTVVNGNLSTAGGWTGGGILVVNGNLSMGGGCQYTGVVICMGDVSIGGGGPADVAHILGGLLYQGTIVNGSGLGGSADVYYSSQAINAAQSLSRYTLAWWRER